MRITETKRVEKTKTLDITEGELRKLLKAQGFDIPPRAAIFFEMPYSGNFSSSDQLDLAECPVKIRWTEVE